MASKRNAQTMAKRTRELAVKERRDRKRAAKEASRREGSPDEIGTAEAARTDEQDP